MRNTSKKRRSIPTKSSITLPPSELILVEELMKRLNAKSKVEVVRLGLSQLKMLVDRESLRQSYREAANKVRASSQEILDDLDPIVDEGLDN